MGRRSACTTTATPTTTPTPPALPATTTHHRSPPPSPPSQGVWDVFSDEQAAAFVHAGLRSGLDLGAICRDLVAQAAVRGSRDDKSAVLPPVDTSRSANLGYLGCARPGRHGLPRGGTPGCSLSSKGIADWPAPLSEASRMQRGQSRLFPTVNIKCNGNMEYAGARAAPTECCSAAAV